MLSNRKFHTIFVSVFHRILDFKAGLDFYLGPFFIFIPFHPQFNVQTSVKSTKTEF